MVIGPLLAALGLAGWGYEASRSQPMLRFPMSIAVGPSGEFFLYTDYGIVRVFDRNGTELRNWRIRSASGAAVLAFDEAGVLHAATIRNQMHYEFDASGKLLREATDPDAFRRLSLDSGWFARSANGEVFEIREGAIVRESASGERETIVAGPPAWFPGWVPHPLMLVPVGLIAPATGAALIQWSREQAGAGRRIRAQ